MNEKQNQPKKTTHVVKIVGLEKECRVEPRIFEVERNDTVVFYSEELNAKISFPDPEFIDIKVCWKNIKKGEKFSVTVKDSAKNETTYFYAVMCEHNDREYWYAEGNTCPAMKVG